MGGRGEGGNVGGDNFEREGGEAKSRIDHYPSHPPLPPPLPPSPSLPPANMRKTLTRIAVAEGKGRAVEEVEGIVASSRGDIRHSILTLQLQLQGRRSSLPSFSSSFSTRGGSKKTKGTKKKEDEEETARRRSRRGRQQQQPQRGQQRQRRLGGAFAASRLSSSSAAAAAACRCSRHFRTLASSSRHEGGRTRRKGRGAGR